MSEVKRDYLIDSDVFITAKNRYYAFEICPGFWDSLLSAHSLGSIHSIDHVKKELLEGRDDDKVKKWVKAQVPSEFFYSCDNATVQAYAEIMQWVNKGNYAQSAKSKFANDADGWLIAYAKAKGSVVVTNEQPAPESKKGVKIPDVCREFKVEFEDTFSMLRYLGIKYTFSPNS